MSKQSASGLRKAINWLLYFTEKKTVFSKKENKTFSFRLSFITLTLSATQSHTDKFIKNHLLQPFLLWMQRKYGGSYVWKAESQLNGNIHFHVTTDVFIHWREIRFKWNKLLARHQYCKIFQDGTNDKGDSATQIKAIKNEGDLAKTVAGYLSKTSIEQKNSFALKSKATTIQDIIKDALYISCNIESKQHHSRFIDGRLWGCSENLSKISISLNSLENDLQTAEHEFFHTNKLKKLSTLIKTELTEKAKKLNPLQRIVMNLTEEEIEGKSQFFDNLYVHRHLKFCKLPNELKKKLDELKITGNFCKKKNYTTNSFF